MSALKPAKLSLMLLAGALCLYGHAILLSSVPASKQVIKGPDVQVRVRFNSRIDVRRSRMTLVAPDGAQTTLVIQDQTSPDTLSSEARGLKGGSYILRWQVLANDGHITRGEVPFQVQ